MPTAGYANGGNRRSTPVPLSEGTPPTDWLDFALFPPCCTRYICHGFLLLQGVII
ncbi:MAG: hypothetical protein V7L25_27350 [Nostoc sp.]|uniref:hypothetical protein n=1 Tax=Nostoc sp. TaxID=1180 RepID=UPI002FEEE8C7